MHVIIFAHIFANFESEFYNHKNRRKQYAVPTERNHFINIIFHGQTNKQTIKLKQPTELRG